MVELGDVRTCNAAMELMERGENAGSYNILEMKGKKQGLSGYSVVNRSIPSDILDEKNPEART